MNKNPKSLSHDLAKASTDNEEALVSSSFNVATPQQTREALMPKSGYTVIRSLFVQHHSGDDAKARHGVLAAMVEEGRHRELVAYLLLLSSWRELQNGSGGLHSNVWCRALTGAGDVELFKNLNAAKMSRVWGKLDAMNLIERKRANDKTLRVKPRCEDAREPYSFPGDSAQGERDYYFTLPNKFWLSNDWSELSLPGLAILLILLKETNKGSTWTGTFGNFNAWYGLSVRSAKTGVQQLKEFGLLEIHESWRPEPLSSIGRTQVFNYGLTGEYSTESRRVLRAKAQAAFEKQRTLSKSESPNVSDATSVTSIGDRGGDLNE